jgi:ATP-dependent RNA helicase RhlE
VENTEGFQAFNLNPAILASLTNIGYTQPTPIQAQAIPYLMEGRDLLGIAQTGTGKTGAFALPLINRLAQNKLKARPARMRSLILTPTRELASQINESLKSYSKGMNIKTTVIFGGVGERPQVMAMSQGVDILVATPGRLLDLMSYGHIKFDQLEVFILDEADRMLDMGFFNDVKKVIAKLPAEKQTLLFSATMPNDIAALANSLLKNPVRIEVTPPSTTVEKIEQKLMYVLGTKKHELLKLVIKENTIMCGLVFTRTKHGADRVVRHLQEANISCAAIHGNKSQGARENALASFKSGRNRILVATDIAARGIDVAGVTHVINYNLPDDAESYVHRIGRTARAGKEGIAIAFCDETELDQLRAVERLTKQKLTIDDKHPFHNEVMNRIVNAKPANNVAKSKPGKKFFTRYSKKR